MTSKLTKLSPLVLLAVIVMLNLLPLGSVQAILTPNQRQAASKGAAVSWPRFRGPNGSGVAEADKPPVEFGPATKLRWKTPLPPGHSSPIVWDDHIFLTGLEKEKLVVIAFQRRDGKLLWKQMLPAEKIEQAHAYSSPAASTPATDGQRVYVYAGSYGLLAYDFKGKEVWRRPLPLPPTQYGTATSPLVFDGKVIVQLDGNNANSELLAVDAQSGAVVWKAARPLLQQSWSTPTIWSHDGLDEVVTMGSGRLVAYSAKDGAERWWAGGLTSQPITVAVHGGGLLFAAARGSGGAPGDSVDVPKWDDLIQTYDLNKDGKLTVAEMPEDAGILLRKEVPKETVGNFITLRRVIGLVDADKDGFVTQAEWILILGFLKANEDNVIAIRPGGSGDSTKSHIVWKTSRGISEIPSPIFYQGRLYFVRDGGMVTSYLPDTGKIVLDRQRLGALGQYCASPVAANGRIYAASDSGTITVFRAGDTLEVLARNELGESLKATPAIADHKLYVRTASYLWAFGD